MYAKKYGKTIKLFLMDADPNGRMICELSNWNGKAYRIPRAMVKDSAQRADLKSTAVYLLFGRPDAASDRPKAYIGEAENAYSRLAQHVSEKEFWNESVLFVSKDENLNKAHIKYLESRLYEIASQANRYELLNGNTPTRSNISEPDQAEMEEFIEYIKILVNTMGYKIFEPIITSDSPDDGSQDTLLLKAARGADASGKRVSDGFVVFAGSQLAQGTVPSFPKSAQTVRDELIANGVISHSDLGLVFRQNHLFSSPSTAAAVIMGRSANGLIEWKDNQGKDLKTIEANEINDAEDQ